MKNYAPAFLVIVALSFIDTPVVQAQEKPASNMRPTEVREINRADKPEQVRLKTTELYQEREQLKENAQQLRENASEASKNTKENVRELKKKALEVRQNLTEEQKNYLDRLKNQRAATAEKLQLKIEDVQNNSGEDAGNKDGANGTSNQISERLQSKNVSAKLQGAQFSIDETTNTVTIVTPSGETHELNHLPDQVVARLIEKKALSESEQIADLEIRQNETGYEYHTTLQKKKKFLGLFSREVETEVVIDDTTGEVSETPVPADNFFGTVLNSLSF